MRAAFLLLALSVTDAALVSDALRMSRGAVALLHAAAFGLLYLLVYFPGALRRPRVLSATIVALGLGLRVWAQLVSGAGLQFIPLLIDCVGIAACLWLAGAWRAPLHWVALYALNPIGLLLPALEGPTDGLARAALLVSVAAAVQTTTRKNAALVALAAALLAATIQPILLIVTPVLFGASALRKVVGLTLGVVVLRWLLPVAWNPAWAGVPPDPALGLGGYGLMRALGFEPPAMIATLLLPAVLIAGVVAYWMTSHADRDRLRAVARTWMWLCVCAPVLHLPLPAILFGLLIMVPSRGWLLFGALAPAIHLLSWPLGAMLWLICIGLILHDLVRKPFLSPVEEAPLDTWDILIPTLNEGARIATCLDAIDVALRKLRGVCAVRGEEPPTVQVHLMDCGSTDETLAIAGARPVVVHADVPRGRGQQLAHGVAASTAPMILMLHADALVDPDGFVVLNDILKKRPRLEWGIFGARFDRRTPGMRLIEGLNLLRFLTVNIPFGDQGIFARRSCIEAAGGVPPIPLMEDVELALRLKQFHHSWHVGQTLLVSARRWEVRDMLQSSSHVVRICIEYLLRRKLGVDAMSISRRMYREYYGREP